jgi:glycosyltransferase involved in cell wall biosynthesis
MVGTIEPRKNYEQAFRIQASSGELPLLVIVGRKGWKSKKVLTRLLSLKNVLWISGACDGSLLEMFQKANCYISTSLNEGFNIPASEAMHLGTPMILSDIPIHQELYPAAQLIHLENLNQWIKACKISNPKIKVEPFESDSEFNRRLELLLESL